jgi:glucosylceramidase
MPLNLCPHPTNPANILLDEWPRGQASPLWLAWKRLTLRPSPSQSTLVQKQGEGRLFWLIRFLRLAPLALALLPSSVGRQKALSPNEALRIEVVESSEELHETLKDMPPLRFGAVRTPNLTITVNDAVNYQQIDGFGASLTDSSAWLLWNKLTEAQRKEAMQMLFSPTKGIGLSFLRQPMGASDFALSDYSYDDLPSGQPISPGDPDLKHFSIDHDRAYIIPLLREALAQNPSLKIIASPWSPPGWMKTSGSMTQGALLPSAYAPLAKYFVRFVQGYEAAGVPIYAITMQNEPMYVPNNYPGMNMTAREQAEFLADYLGPAFRDAHLKTKIMVFDHNWDLIEYPIQVLSDAKAAAFAAGTAIHCYGGNVTAQNELHERFPEKDIWLTECSGGDWQKGDVLQQQVRLVIGAIRNWAKSVLLWNLALDQNHEPFLGGCTNCRGIITVNHAGQPSQIVPTVDYTALAHAGKFVAPGAYRVESNTFDQGSLEDVAFRNPDGSLILLVLNSGGSTTFNIAWAGKYASYKLPGGAVATFRWNCPTNSH